MSASGCFWILLAFTSSDRVKSVVLSEDKPAHLGLEETQRQRQRASSSDSAGTSAIPCLGLGLTISADLSNNPLVLS